VSAGWDRLVDRAVIAAEAAAVAERRCNVAVVNAEYLLAPRVKLVDEQQRLVRFGNAPASARPPRVLSHWYTDTMHRRGVEAIGKYHDRPNWRDIDYRVPKTAAGDHLIALLRDEIEPSVVERRFSNGATDLLTSFER
jgi:hypothetical protein